jgi:hypothetical protein
MISSAGLRLGEVRKTGWFSALRYRYFRPELVVGQPRGRCADEFYARFEPYIDEGEIFEAFNNSTSRRRYYGSRETPLASGTSRFSLSQRVYPTQRRKLREIPVRGTQRQAMLQRQRGQMRVRHEIGMHAGEREEFI